MKLLLTLMITMLSFVSFSQAMLEYPRIETDSLGRKVVIMTVEQAQKIDNNFEILALLTRQGSECDSLNVAYLKVIDNQGRQISLLELSVTELKNQIKDKDSQIVNLQTQLANEEKSNDLCEKQKENNEAQIKILKKEITKQKIQKVVGFIVGVAGVVGGVVLLIVAH